MKNIIEVTSFRWSCKLPQRTQKPRDRVLPVDLISANEVDDYVLCIERNRYNRLPE